MDKCELPCAKLELSLQENTSSFVTFAFLQIVGKLLSSNADVNIADKRGATPLHRAASRGNTDILKALLACGNQIVIDSKDAYGNTPL